VLNEGTVPLRLLGYTIWCGENQTNRPARISHNSVIPPGSPPIHFEAISTILEAISGRPPFDFVKVQGGHTITFAIEYQDGAETKESKHEKQNVRISLVGTNTFEAEISSYPFSI